MRTNIVAAMNDYEAVVLKLRDHQTVSTPISTHRLLVPPELATPDQVSLLAPQIRKINKFLYKV